MNRLACVLLIVLLAGSLVSCDFPGSKLKPGDKIGDMELTTAFDKNIHELCDFSLLHDGTCEIPASITTIGVSTGWAEGSTKELELSWLDSKWELTIDDHKVDLPAFGTFDLETEGQQARVWDVGLSNLALGKHTVRYAFTFVNGMRRGNHGEVWSFTVVPSDQVQSPSSSTPTQAPDSGGAAIEPGDRIGEFLITSGRGKDVVYSWEDDTHCIQQGSDKIYACQVPVGTKVNVSLGVYDDSLSGKLDEYWSNHTYEMYIEGRPVDLKAFGSVDVTHPKVGPMRHWNVVIVATAAGRITVSARGVVGGNPFEDTTAYVFSAP